MPKPESSRSIFRSLRWRLQVWHALILLLVVACFGTVFYLEARRTRLDEIDAELLAGARVLEGVLRTSSRGPVPGPEGRRGGPGFEPGGDASGPAGARPRPDWRRPSRPGFEKGAGPPPRFRPGMAQGPGFGPPPDFGPPPRPDDDPFGPPPRPERGRMPRHPGGGPDALALQLPFSLVDRHSDEGQTPYLVIRGPQGGVIREEPAGVADETPSDPWVAPGAGWEWHARSRRVLREVSLRGPDQTVILVGRPIGRELGGLWRLAWQIAGTGLGVFSLGLLGSWWLSARAVRPIETMSQTVSRITATSLSRRLDLAGFDTELGRLGGLVNTMLGRLESAFEQQARFTADASHELRTPLAVIRSHVELALARPRSGDEYRDALGACRRAAGRMTSLVDDLLLLARADAGRLDLRREPIDLAELAEEQVDLVATLAARRSLSLDVDVQPAPIAADPTRLGQVLTNLLTNSIHYNRPGGSVTLRVREEGDAAVVTVADTGIGIPEADLPRIFDRFHRVDEARNRSTGGSGLGLAIARSLVEAHGGTIDVASQLDVGTTFTLRLPRLAPPGTDPKPTAMLDAT